MHDASLHFLSTGLPDLVPYLSMHLLTAAHDAYLARHSRSDTALVGTSFSEFAHASCIVAHSALLSFAADSGFWH